MSEKLTLKQMIEVATKKELPVPNESGLVSFYSHGTLSSDEESLEKKSGGANSLEPTEEELFTINEIAKVPQEKSNWTILRNVDPVGDPDLVDSHGDVFSPTSLKDMAAQALATPVLCDHDHDLGGKPPIGMCIAARVSKGRLKETWALPNEDYNSAIVKGMLNGTINKISIGAFINPKDKICNSCETRSIYSVECPHYPGGTDEKGNVTTVTIKRVKRYAERSLVNVPARLGTSVKSLFTEENVVLRVENRCEGLEIITRDNVIIGESKSLEEPSATISPVINEDSIVSEKQEDVKAPEEVQEPAQEQEVVAPAAPVTEEEAKEDAAPQEEVKSVELPVVKALEVEALTKSFVESLKVDVESTNKALEQVNEKFVKLAEMQEKSANDLGALTASVLALTEQVQKAVEMSSEETIEKLYEVVAGLKAQVDSQKEVVLPSVNDQIHSLLQ